MKSLILQQMKTLILMALFVQSLSAQLKNELTFFLVGSIDIAQTMTAQHSVTHGATVNFLTGEPIHGQTPHRFREQNPLLGKYPSNLKLIAGGVLIGASHYFVASRIKNKIAYYTFQALTIGAESLMIYRSYKLGLHP